MLKRFTIIHLITFSIICTLGLFGSVSVALSESSPAVDSGGYTILDVKADIQQDLLKITLKGSSPPNINTYAPTPTRLVIDIADATFAKGVNPKSLLPENDIAALTTHIIANQIPATTRFEMTYKDSYSYKIDRDGNDILILVHPDQPGYSTQAVSPAKTTPPIVAQAPVEKEKATDTILQNQIAEAAALTTITNNAEGDIRLPATIPVNGVQESFSGMGYEDGELITMDFYKIDLHNVFRLFREISGMNLIVEDSVQGSLTLGLKDVPWDFALDVILNLKDLVKEERFNTIVISPKGREFSWPQRVSDNLEIEEDQEIIAQDELTISFSENQPAEIGQAKELMRQALGKEDKGDFEEAAALYEKAFELWPVNSKISNRLATLYLVTLRMNAKAVNYAEKTLQLRPDNSQAALYAAIGYANMKNIPQAQELFSLSTSGQPPMKEALMSYAAFLEQQNQNQSALTVIKKYTDHYGESLNTMISKARMYDKMNNKVQADEQYRAILTSGFMLQPDLKKFIRARLTPVVQSAF